MFEANVRRKIQTELCQLHRNFGLQTALSDALQDFEIVLHDLSSLRAILDIFAQVCEDRPDLLPTQNLCRAKRIIERFAGHEPGYSAPEKLVMCRAITQPLVLRYCEQHRSHETHEFMVSLPWNRLRWDATWLENMSLHIFSRKKSFGPAKVAGERTRPAEVAIVRMSSPVVRNTESCRGERVSSVAADAVFQSLAPMLR